MARNENVKNRFADMKQAREKDQQNKSSQTAETEFPIFDSDRIYHTKNYEQFVPYPKDNLRLPLHTGEKYEQLEQSLLNHGMTTPLKVIRSEDCSFANFPNGTFVILGGHNRLNIAQKHNLDVIFRIMPNLSEEDCDRIMAEEVFLNRQFSELKPSQILALIKAMNHNYSYTELAEIAKGNETFTLKRSMIRLYLKLDGLIPEFLKYVDDGKISIVSGSNLSELDLDKQQQLYEFCINSHIAKIKPAQIDVLLKNNDEEWDKIFLKSVFKAKTSSIPAKIGLKTDLLRKYIPEEDMERSQEIIIEALKQYYHIQES